MINILTRANRAVLEQLAWSNVLLAFSPRRRSAEVEPHRRATR
jgi:hypothetical protein